jgi:hypothetical protein
MHLVLALSCSPPSGAMMPSGTYNYVYRDAEPDCDRFS